MIKIDKSNVRDTVEFSQVREGVFFSAFGVKPESGIYMRIGDKLLTFQNNGNVVVMNYSNVAMTPVYYDSVTIAI